MTSIQASREKAARESADRNAQLEETRKDNRARRNIDQQNADTNRDSMNAKSREVEIKRLSYELDKSLAPVKAFESFGKGAKGIGDAIAGASKIGTALAANDWKWYFDTYQRMSDVTSLPLFLPYGQEFDFGDGETTIDTTSSAPGILAIQSAHTIGWAQNESSAVQRAAETFFDTVNTKTGRNSDYEASDLMLTALAFASLEAYSEHLKRAYRCCSLTSPDNEYLPRRLIEIMGFDYDDFIANKIGYRDHINYLEDMKFKYLSIPGLPIRERWKYEYANVFADHTDTAMQQYYLYIPRHFFKLDIGKASPTKLDVKLWIDKDTGFIPSYKLSQVREFTNDLLAGFANMQDAKMMKADIKLAYGERAQYVKSYIYENEGPQLISPDALSLVQFKNAIILHKDPTNKYTSENEYTIRQDDQGYILSNPSGVTRDHSSYITRMPIIAEKISSFSAPQRNVLAVEATRMMQMPNNFPTPESDSVSTWQLTAPTASVADRVYVVATMGVPHSGDGPVYGSTVRFVAIDEQTVWGDDNLSAARYFLLTVCNSFDWMPRRFLRGTIEYGLGDQVESILPIDPWDQALTIDKQQLKHMNDTIALHLFGGVGSVDR